MFDDRFLQPLADEASLAGDGLSGGQADPTGGQATPNAEPQAVDLGDDTLVRVKGSDKPVKFADHVRGFQSQFTKASQRASALERELQQERSARQQLENAQRQAAQATGTKDPYEQLRQLPYLDGNAAAQVVDSIAQQIRQRDMILLGTLQQLQQMQAVVQGLNQTHVSQSWESKIDRWLADGGFPPEAKDLAKEIYLAYEGDDLDEEFPRIFGERWNQIEKLVEARRQAAVRAARPQPFVPGKGGNTGPSKGLKMNPKASAREVADQLWHALDGGSET